MRNLKAPKPLLFFLLLGLLLAHWPATAVAQSAADDAYWRYSASRRLTHLLPADIDRDGVDEFLLVTENGRVDLLNAHNGNPLWSYIADAPIHALHVIQTDPQARAPLNIALAVGHNLLLLDETGQQLWQTPLTAIDAPPLSALTGQNNLVDWFASLNLNVYQITAVDSNNDGREEILVLFDNGQFCLFDSQGNLLERVSRHAINYQYQATEPHLQVADLNQDGRQEIVLGLYNPNSKFSQLFLFSQDGTPLWEAPRAISGYISALALPPFGENGNQQIAVSNDHGELHLFDYNRQAQWWPRTLNVPITALTVAQFPAGPALVAGTEGSLLTAYNSQGHRFWTRRLTSNAQRPIIGISAISYLAEGQNPALAVVLGADTAVGGNQQVKLLGVDGLEVESYEAGEGNVPLTQLLDINGDRYSELLLAHFATVELHGLGVGTSETAAVWRYSLNAAPGDWLVLDADNDGRDELLLGAQNGRLHFLGDNNSLDWLHAPGGDIVQLALVPAQADVALAIVVGRNTIEPTANNVVQSWVELRQSNGERLWAQPLSAAITDLLVHDLDADNRAEILVATNRGDVIVLDIQGQIQWQNRINPQTGSTEPIRQLLVVDAPNEQAYIVAATAQNLYTTAVGSTVSPWRSHSFSPATFQTLLPLNQPGTEFANRLLALSDGLVGLNWRSQPLPFWNAIDLNGSPITAVEGNTPLPEDFAADLSESFFVATDAGQVVRLSVQENKPELHELLDEIPDITALYWGDLSGDRLPELVVGDQRGNVRLYGNIHAQPQLVDELNLASSIFAMTALQRGQENRADLLVIMENGEVQLFSAQENRPPLLSNFGVEVGQGQYSFNITVMDIDGDEVRVRLDIQDPQTGEWLPQRESLLVNGNGPLFWNLINPLTAVDGVHYRYHFADKVHAGYVYPPAGPLPIPVAASGNNLTAVYILLLILGGLFLLFLFARQMQAPTLRTHRFYWRLRRNPADTLTRLENRYISTNGSPDFLLTLSGLARQRSDELVSDLADGLFLLPERPQAGLPLILDALQKGEQAQPPWQGGARWQLIFKTGQELLTSPSLTALSLEWPQLQKALDTLDKAGQWSASLFALVTPLMTIRDSERVKRLDDRLVYLHEAKEQLTAVLQELPDYNTAIDKPLALAIARRWDGLVSSQIEELQGRAEIAITLKTRRIVPGQPTQLIFELVNNGRAPAENIIAVLNDDPAYSSNGEPEVITMLPAGRTRSISFDVQPLVDDRFRIGVTVTFDDRSQNDRAVAFGDQVSVLRPQREFTPIPNPYRPGTPLRRNSSVFYGRESLFEFIAENAGNWTQRNILILVGQRRAGKTSVLLNLEKHLPSHLIPVYIDCQSLGVTPGMPALFHDIAWLIADVLAARDIDIDVPEIPTWEADPVNQLQRHFLPKVRQLIDANSTLLLVFDEFEAFESLVDDGILPSTFFNYLRHLMQHSEGLSFVFVGTRHLEAMSADYWSVMFNIALYQRITYLREESATRLITEPVSPYLLYDDLAIDKILRVTAGHPYFLQLVCYSLVQQANNQRKGYVTISDVNVALDEMLTLGEVHFAYLWQRSSYTEQAILTAVSHMTDHNHPFRPEEFIEFLEPYGIHLHATEVSAALNTLVEREIMNEVRDGVTTQYELHLGLVALWVAQHKSLSKLHASSTNGNSSPKVSKPRQKRNK